MNIAEVQSMIKERMERLFSTPKMESFTLPPYQEPNLDVEPELKKYMTDYAIVPREMYDVLKKFEIKAKDLTKDERTLRKKYLDKFKTIIINEYEKIKTQAQASIPQDAQVYMDEVRVMMLYVIDLMMQDIDLIDNPVAKNCPVAPKCPDATKNYNMIFIGIIVLLVIGLIAMFMMR